MNPWSLRCYSRMVEDMISSGAAGQTHGKLDDLKLDWNLDWNDQRDGRINSRFQHRIQCAKVKLKPVGVCLSKCGVFRVLFKFDFRSVRRTCMKLEMQIMQRLRETKRKRERERAGAFAIFPLFAEAKLRTPFFVIIHYLTCRFHSSWKYGQSVSLPVRAWY